MSKYFLVASNYQNQQYENEIILKEDTLVQIDSFTSSKTNFDFICELQKENRIHLQDTFSILCTRKNKNPIYYSAIWNDKRLNSSLNHLVEKKSFRKKNVLSLRFDDPYFIENWEILKQLILDRNIKRIKELFKENDLLFLINRYLNSFYDNFQEEEKDFHLIKTEFSHYGTFREYLISSKKKVVKNQIKKEEPSSRKKIISKEKEEYEREYEQKLQTLYGMKYELLQASNYNRKYLEEDIEEFLEPDEIDQMNGKMY